MMKTLGANECNILRKDIDAALADIKKKHGVNMKIGTMTYSGERITCRLTCSILDENPESACKERFIKNAKYFDIPDEAYAKTYQYNGKSYTFKDIKPAAKKYPIIALVDGKQMKLTSSFAREIIGKTV